MRQRSTRIWLPIILALVLVMVLGGTVWLVWDIRSRWQRSAITPWVDPVLQSRPDEVYPHLALLGLAGWADRQVIELDGCSHGGMCHEECPVRQRRMERIEQAVPFIPRIDFLDEKSAEDMGSRYVYSSPLQKQHGNV